MDEEQEFLEEAQRVRDEQLASEGVEGDPAVQAAIDHAAETAGTGPEPGSEQPGYFGLGGLSSSEIEAQKLDTARRMHSAEMSAQQQPPVEPQSSRLGVESVSAIQGGSEAGIQAGSDEQQFLADAEQVRHEQVGSGGVANQGDPAVQAAIDHAAETAGTGPEPGSQQPGYFGLGGLSLGEIEAQKQEIAESRNRPA
jgi:hypothetical protein